MASNEGIISQGALCTATLHILMGADTRWPAGRHTHIVLHCHSLAATYKHVHLTYPRLQFY